MDAATAIQQARRMARLSKRELARRAGTSPAAIVMYESRTREPTLPTLLRILDAAGYEGTVDVAPARPLPDPHINGARLAQLLDLADRLPQRPASRRLTFPPLAG